MRTYLESSHSPSISIEVDSNIPCPLDLHQNSKGTKFRSNVVKSRSMKVNSLSVDIGKQAIKDVKSRMKTLESRTCMIVKENQKFQASSSAQRLCLVYCIYLLALFYQLLFPRARPLSGGFIDVKMFFPLRNQKQKVALISVFSQRSYEKST